MHVYSRKRRFARTTVSIVSDPPDRSVRHPKNGFEVGRQSRGSVCTGLSFLQHEFASWALPSFSTQVDVAIPNAFSKLAVNLPTTACCCTPFNVYESVTVRFRRPMRAKNREPDTTTVICKSDRPSCGVSHSGCRCVFSAYGGDTMPVSRRCEACWHATINLLITLQAHRRPVRRLRRVRRRLPRRVSEYTCSFSGVPLKCSSLRYCCLSCEALQVACLVVLSRHQMSTRGWCRCDPGLSSGGVELVDCPHGVVAARIHWDVVLLCSSLSGSNSSNCQCFRSRQIFFSSPCHDGGHRFELCVP